jgi:putative endonuclease
VKRHNKDLGDLGEKYAVKRLRRRRYKIVATNYSCKLGEIDIIAAKGEYIVFIEVKTRDNSEFGRPAEAVNGVKQRRIAKIASVYMTRHSGRTARFDVIEILGRLRFNGKLKVNEFNHIENAFY